MLKKLVCCFLLSLCIHFSSFGQIADSTSSITPPKKEVKEETILKKKHSPTKATLYSTFLPGLGQVYNKKYWKVPIIYGLGAFFVYNISSSHSEYTNYRDALNARQDTTQTPLAFGSQYSDSQLRTRKDFYKRKRDINFIYALLLYSANIIDAAVDAHLIDFKVGEQYIMSLEPTFFPSASVSSSIGLSLTVNIK